MSSAMEELQGKVSTLISLQTAVARQKCIICYSCRDAFRVEAPGMVIFARNRKQFAASVFATPNLPDSQGIPRSEQ